MLKKALCVISVVALIFSISSCGSGGKDQYEEIVVTEIVNKTVTNAQGQVVTDAQGNAVTETSVVGTDTQASQTTQTDANGNTVTTKSNSGDGSSSGNKKVVNLWLINQGKNIQKALNQAATDFNNTNGKNIQGQISYKAAGGDSGYTGFDDQLVPAIAAGKGPDLIVTGRQHYKEYVNVSNYIQKYSDSDFSPSMVYQSNLLNVQVDGTYYGLPFSSTYAVFLLYNKTMFKKAGLDPNKPPKTLDQLDEYAEKLTTSGTGGKYATVGFCPWEWYIKDMVGPYTLFDGGIKSLNGTPTPNTAQNVKALEWVQKYVNKYGYQKLSDSLTAISPGGSPFGSGKLGMQMVYSGHIADGASWTFEWGVADMPGEKGAIDGATTTDLMAIFKTSKHPEEAFLFAKALCGKKTQTKLMAYANEMPTFSPLKSANEANYDVFNPTMRSILKDIYPGIKGKVYKAQTGKCPDNYGTLVDEMFNKVLTGGNPASLLKDLEKKVNAAIAQM